MAMFNAFAKPATQPQPLFGSTQPAAAGTGTFGGFQQNAQPPSQGTSLFGGSTFGQNQQQQTPATTGLFGQQQSQQPASTGIFGQSTAGQQQPAATGLFGQPAVTQPQQQPANQSTFGGGLFGSSTNQAQQNQPTQQPSLFGGFGANNAAIQQQQPQQLQTSTFGSFGAKPLQPQTSAQGAFGGSTNTGGGTSLFGQSQQVQQQQQPIGTSSFQSAAATQFTRSTKFNDLPEETRKMLENIDAHIQGRVQISAELKQHKLGEEPVKGTEQIRSVHKDLVNMINKLRTDISSMRDLKAKMEQSVQDTIAATQIIDGFRNPQQHGVHLKTHANFPLEYFTRVTHELRDRLQWFNGTIEQIERKLASDASHVSASPHAIAATLQAQHASFVALANKTAALDADLQKLKTTYTQLWRERTGSARDPFNQYDRGVGGEFGIEGLNIK